jgi:hypothetical protein
MTEKEYLDLPFDSIMTVPTSMCPSGLSHVVFRPRIASDPDGTRRFAYVNDDNKSVFASLGLLSECGVKTLGSRAKIIHMVVRWPDGREVRVAGKTGYVYSRWDDKEKKALHSVEVEGEYLEDLLTFDGATDVREDGFAEGKSPE